MFLAAATLFSCSYDSSEIENGITDLENRVAALEQKADYLESQLKAVSEFVSGNFISRVGTDEKGNFVITYQDRNGEKHKINMRYLFRHTCFFKKDSNILHRIFLR